MLIDAAVPPYWESPLTSYSLPLTIAAIQALVDGPVPPRPVVELIHCIGSCDRAQRHCQVLSPDKQAFAGRQVVYRELGIVSPLPEAEQGPENPCRSDRRATGYCAVLVHGSHC